MMQEHKVVKISLSSGSDTATIAAGNGTSTDQKHTMLKLSLTESLSMSSSIYMWQIGDNNRIQLFQPGQLNATTMAGSGAPGTITLSHPSAVILDADGYLFISDNLNNRIVRSGPFGFQCLLGCSAVAGGAANQLNIPRGLAFDSYGNLFVVDRSNRRLQKFLLATNSCGKYLLLY